MANNCNIKKSKGKLIFFIVLCLAVLAIAAYGFRLYYAGTAVTQGEIAYDQGDYDRAIAQYTRAIKLGYEKETSLFWRGRAYYEYLWYDAAIADFSKAIALRPDDYTYYLWCGKAYYKKEEYDSAIAYFTDAIKLDTDESYGAHHKYVERGEAYEAKGDFALAIQDYNQAIAQIDDKIAYRLQLHKETPEFGFDDIQELSQWRDEVVAIINGVEKRRDREERLKNAHGIAEKLKVLFGSE
jgi:tetratricopeptide (TPR) repeat protein